MANHINDHSKIRQWVEERGGVPATVEDTVGADDSVGILRIDFPYGERDDALSTISWDDFFDKFEREKLSFLCEDKTSDGELSRFCKFVHRE